MKNEPLSVRVLSILLCLPLILPNMVVSVKADEQKIGFPTPPNTEINQIGIEAPIINTSYDEGSTSIDEFPDEQIMNADATITTSNYSSALGNSEQDETLANAEKKAAVEASDEGLNNTKSEKNDTKLLQTPTTFQENSPSQSREEPIYDTIANADDAIVQGAFGTSKWKLDSEGTLHIGAGEFDSTGPTNPASESPWLAYASQIKQIVFEGNVLGNANSASLFSKLYNLESIQNLYLFDTSQVTDMNSMFSECENLTSLDVSTFDTSRVTDMGGMFAYDRNLISLNVTGFNVSKVSYLNMMFGECSSLKNLDTSTFHTPVNGQGSMLGMFRNCSSLEYLDLSGFDTSKINPNINIDFLAGTTSLSKIKLGEKFRFTEVEALPEVPNNSQFTGKWQNIGTGTSEAPNGEFEFTSEELMLYGTYDGSTMADTYVWQPVANSAAADVTVNYVDEEGTEIPNVSPQTISGNIGDLYDASTDAYKLVIEGYTLDESKLPVNAKGTFTDQPQTVTYVYSKDQTAVNVHDSSIYVGDVWKPEDNFDNASSADGDSLDYAGFIAAGGVADNSQLDTNTPGTYPVTYTLNGVTSTANITVKDKQTAVNVHNSTIYVGDDWTAQDSFDSATDKDGNPVDLSQVTVDDSKADTSKAGTFDVTYTYDGVTSTATVTVKAKQTAVNVHNSTIYVGDDWTAQDNFDSATDKDGFPVDLSQVTVDDSKVDTSKAGTFNVTYTYDGVTSTATITVLDKVSPKPTPEISKDDGKNTDLPKASSNDTPSNSGKTVAHENDDKVSEHKSRNALPQTGASNGVYLTLFGLAVLVGIVLTFSLKNKPRRK